MSTICWVTTNLLMLKQIRPLIIGYKHGGDAGTQSFTPLVELNTTKKLTIALDVNKKKNYVEKENVLPCKYILPRSLFLQVKLNLPN